MGHHRDSSQTHWNQQRLHLNGVKEPPKLSLPGKLIFPSMQNSGHFSMLGLGDIVMPGLLLCFVLRYDAYKRAQLNSVEAGVPPPNHLNKITYFHCSLIGYFFGLLTATVSSEVFKAAQPALLYLVPFTLLPLLTMAYIKGDLRRMWSEPFITANMPKHLEVWYPLNFLQTNLSLIVNKSQIMSFVIKCKSFRWK